MKSMNGMFAAGVAAVFVAGSASAASVSFIDEVVVSNQGGAELITGETNGTAITLDGSGVVVLEFTDNLAGVGAGDDLRIEQIGSPSGILEVFVRATSATAAAMGLSDLGAFLPAGEFIANTVLIDLDAVVSQFSSNGSLADATFDRVLLRGGDTTSGVDSVEALNSVDVLTVDDTDLVSVDTDIVSAPSPSIATAGLAMLAGLAVRRRRNA